MHYVYIIKSKKYPKELYKGYAKDLKERIRRHNSGSSKYTAQFKPWEIIFYCAFKDKKQALGFEKYLKTASGIAFMRKRLI
ncbi:GIY-YIG nuclease family protein [Patescibacteria group bacterium]|nr:GIY-YIG nuclease family protein [Patescibacteria group bacterium]MBU1921947.1 GIY-YIG nuclease family protein [Patescibacteria group bacterium]